MPEPEDTTPANSFVSALGVMEYGNLIPECSDSLATLVKQVAATGRKGKFVLSLEVKPAKTGGQIKVESEIKVTPPKPEKGESLFFTGVHGELLRSNPAQKEMDFGSAPKPVRQQPVAAAQ